MPQYCRIDWFIERHDLTRLDAYARAKNLKTGSQVMKALLDTADRELLAPFTKPELELGLGHVDVAHT